LPHSGSHYPERLRQLSRLSAHSLRRSEDAFLDGLLNFAGALGIAMVMTPFARAYVDLNRSPHELDPLLVGAPLPPGGLSDRTAAGLGVVPRSVGSGIDIYACTLDMCEVEQRISTVHTPYHDALAELIAATRRQHGFAVVLDFHSMPSGKWHGKALANIVLGDCHGRACGAALTEFLHDACREQNFNVARNAPYAGGYSTAFHGAPLLDVHMLQIEIDRSLYMDEARIVPHTGFAMLHASLAQVLGALMAALPTLQHRLRTDWHAPLAAE
jgi:N-formylglutamate amidohydrolase